ncbi:MAG TPA: hypothetical protein VF096_15095 [Azonexus sp.]
MRRYFEFAVVVLLLSVLALVLLRAIGQVRRDLEEAQMQAEAAAIRAELLEVLVHRETFGGSLPSGDNPLDWVPGRPRNYLGARDGMPAQTSVWYFDRGAGELIYRFDDGHRARFRLSRAAGGSQARGVLAGVGLLRLGDQRE